MHQADAKKDIRDIRIQLVTKKFSNYYIPYDKEAERYTTANRYDSMKYVNLPTKEVVA